MPLFSAAYADVVLNYLSKTNFLSSQSEVDFLSVNLYFHKLVALDNHRSLLDVLEKSLSPRK